MTNEPEWGPWTQHDGKGCPVDGQYVRVEKFNGQISEGIAGSVCRARGVSPDDWFASNWVWLPSGPVPADIRAYRVRKPRGLTILDALLADTPDEVMA